MQRLIYRIHYLLAICVIAPLLWLLCTGLFITVAAHIDRLVHHDWLTVRPQQQQLDKTTLTSYGEKTIEQQQFKGVYATIWPQAPQDAVMYRGADSDWLITQNPYTGAIITVQHQVVLVDDIAKQLHIGLFFSTSWIALGLTWLILLQILLGLSNYLQFSSHYPRSRHAVLSLLSTPLLLWLTITGILLTTSTIDTTWHSASDNLALRFAYWANSITLVYGLWRASNIWRR